MSKPDEPKRVPVDQFHLSRWRTTIVNVYGELTTWPAPKNEGDHKYRMMFYADQCKRVFPQLDWLREEANRYAAVVGAGLSELNDLIALAEANRTDWTRLVELVAMIGGNLENLTPEESAAVRLVNGFSSARANVELRRALHEAEKIRRRIGDRFTEAVRAGQLEIKGRSASDLKVLVTIPKNFVTTDLIWSLLRSSELVIAGQHYVDVQIGPSEPPEATPEPQHAVSPSGQRAGQPSAEPPQLLQVEPVPSAGEPTPEFKPASTAAVHDAIDRSKEWLLEPGRTEKEKRERIEQLAGGTVSRDQLRPALKARVPDLNRGRGRPRKK